MNITYSDTMRSSMFARIFKTKSVVLGLVWAALIAPLVIGLWVEAGIPSTTNSGSETTYDLQPVINSQTVPPLVLLVMSRDEQLYNKAYTDYTDLHQGEPTDPGTIDSTYDDTFSYSGYFGAGLCYSYSSSVFKADNVAAGTNGHTCSSEWSGNFLNWLAMSRLDIVRSVLYGGLRSTDTGGGTSAQTVLERAAIPNDLHAWVKVYYGSDVASFTPFPYVANSPVSFCNASIYSSSGVPSTAPLMRVARGNYSEWSATQDSQCNWNDTDSDPNNPKMSQGLGSKEYTVRVDVCDEQSNPTLLAAATTAGATGEHCQAYTDVSTSPATVTYKPVGLLQQYGESGKIRFGLMTGSYADPRSGGRLRRNIGLFAGNGTDPTKCATGDEVKLSNGTFCVALSDTTGTEGIINTLNRLQLVGWQSNTSGSGSGWMGDAAGDNCYAWGGRARNGNGGTWVMDNPGGGDHHCSAYGNPLSEIYAEAVRYIEGNGNVATKGLSSGNPTSYETNNDTSYIKGIPDHITWKDPYRNPTSATDPGNPYCASCSILVLSTGLNSFDSDEFSNDVKGMISPASIITATNLVGGYENINGNDYLIGRVLGKKTDNGTISPTKLTVGASIDTNADLCTRKTIDVLSDAIGVCLDVPSLEGSYDLAGLAYEAWNPQAFPIGDLRPDLVSAAGQNKPATYINRVQTYTVALAETLPNFAIKTASGTINFSPLCQSNTNGSAVPTDANWSSCALGAVEVGTKTSIVTPNNYIYGRPLLSNNSAGSFSFVWEDSTFGSDHDLDATDIITWCVGSACSYTNGQSKKNMDGSSFSGYDICWRSDHTSTASDYSAACGTSDKPSVGTDEVLVRIETMSTAGGYAMLTGYNISGTTNDGVNRVALAAGSFNSLLTGQVDPPTNWYRPVILKFKLGSSGVGPLQNPLYYAAKYGGFQDSNNNNKPDLVTEWDNMNNTTGQVGVSDGLPDNFFPVHNPANLANQLGNALNAIIKNTGSGTAAAVVSNSVNGEGTVYRALYNPQTQDASLNKVYWTGSLNALWTDSYGYLREDANGNATLDGYGTDPIIVFFTDPTTSVAEFSECLTSNASFDPSKFDPTNIGGTCPGNTGRLNQPLANVKTVWDAAQQLWASSGKFVTNIETQRTYSDLSSNGRYIFTWIDKNHNGVVDSGEQTDFVWSGNTTTCTTGFCGKGTSPTWQGDFGFLNSDNPTEAKCIVNWIRGEESNVTNACGMRSRTIDGTAFGGSSGSVVARLGDIIDSTPLVVSKPAEAYDLLYGDNSYATFKSHYLNRRQVVYTGANDGMLHAFNGGYYYSSLGKLCLQPPADSTSAPTDCNTSSSVTKHPLGGEIWAYVPGNLLPHLRWLTSTSYKAQHVFYVDGNPVATDAKIFNDDGDCSSVAPGAQCHPGGWGTVLVVPFRLGGGMIKVPTPTAASNTYNPSTCPASTSTNKCTLQTSYSAYVVLDVTDPEQPPTVLAELHPASDDGNGQSFTSSVPAFAVMRNPSSGTPNQFFMFIGSGPTGANGVNPAGVSAAVTSTAPMRVYAYDLGCLTNQTTKPTDCGATAVTPLTLAGSKTSFDFTNVGGTGMGAKSFAGDLIASDFDLNARAEAVYLGSMQDPGTGKTPIEFSGSLWKINLAENTDPTTWKAELMSNVGKPISIRPTLGLTSIGSPEVYIGTGRLFSKNDLSTIGQQQILGMIDPEELPGGTVQTGFGLPISVAGDLENVSNVAVCGDTTNTLCTYGTVTGDPSGATTFDQFEQMFNSAKTATPIAGKAGFVYNLIAPGTSPAQRVVSAQALLGGVLITNAFTPGVSICNNVGIAMEFVMNYQTGSGDPAFSTSTGAGFGLDANGNVSVSASLGAGLPAAPSLHVGTGTGEHELTACTQTSTGAIICQKITTLSSVLSKELSWREPLDQ